MKIIQIGHGTVGKVLLEKLKQKNIDIVCVVKSDGIYNSNLEKIDEKKNFESYLRNIDAVFVATPSIGKGDLTFPYVLKSLENNIPVITCEKASLAYHWDKLSDYKDLILNTATVGVGARMLKKIKEFNKEIVEIKGVINGTLNYISSELKNGKTKELITREVLEKGFAEPGADDFDSIIKSELNDVLLKAVITSNSSGIFNQIIKPEKIEPVYFKKDKVCIVQINKKETKIGFIEDINSGWIPDGVENCLLINNEKVASGPGAGPGITADVMIEDFEDYFNKV